MAAEPAGGLASRFARRLTNAPAELPELMTAVAAFLDQGGVEASTRFALLLCVDELVSNVMMHGYPEGGADDLALTLELALDAATLTLEDGGVAFDPVADAPAAVIAGPASARRVGGLGVHAVRAHVDELAYDRREGRNVLRVVKRRAP